MNVLMVSYDLIKDRDYRKLIGAIQQYSNHKRILLSQWAIITNHTAAQVRDYLQQYVDYDDRLLVIRIATPAAWKNLPADVSEWLQRNLS